MGDNYGPIVVAREDGPSTLHGITVAVPGTLTTAYLTLRLYDPDVAYVVMPFDRIQDAVREGEVAAGLLIHEGQLTYQDEGLKKIVDLGEWWAERTGGLPLPLGGNIIRRDLGLETMRQVSKMLEGPDMTQQPKSASRLARLRSRHAEARHPQIDKQERAVNAP